jgi:glycosyltransferase involved in cell wall biosynthesis
MRINIFMGPWFPVPTVQGGSTHRAWHGLAEQFAAQGHKVTVVCRSYQGQAPRETVNSVTYLRRSGFAQSTSTGLNLLRDLFYGARMLPLIPRGDILVINDFWFPILARLFRRNAGRVVVNANRFPKRQFSFYGGAARFAAASQAIRRGIEAQSPAAGARVRVFPNPTDIAIFRPADAAPHALTPAGTILYVGRIHPEKGLSVLLAAFAKLAVCFPRLKLKIVGPYKEEQGGGGQDYLQTLKKMMAGLNVEFVEPIFDLQFLAQTYQSAGLFCYPSQAEKGEAFPVAPLEAMATGLVPLVSDLDCFRDLIDEGANGFYFQHRGEQAAQNLADKVAFAVQNPAAIRRMGQNALEKAQEFSYQKVAAQYLEDFEALLKEGTASGVTYLYHEAGN